MTTVVKAAERGRTVVPRRWIGVSDTPWNPTLTLMAAVVAAVGLLATGWIRGAIPTGLAVAGLALSYYAAFTVLHESMHGLAHRNRQVNAWLGRVAGFALMLPSPLFRAAHLAHHTHTNDPERDPDIMVAHRPAWLAPLWFLWTPVHYRVIVYGGGLLRNRAARWEAWLTDAAIVAGLSAAVMLGWGAPVLYLWVAPAALAILWLALAFDLLPHRPHTSRERYYDTRAYPGRLLNAVLLGQNYHLVHHLWTTIPWYRYAAAYRDVRADLEARGAPIGWHRRAERLPSAQDL